jgi:hypothetical protein
MSVSGFAQTDSISNPYIQKFSDKISTQLFVLNTSNQFTFNYVKDNLVVDLVPNLKTTMGVAVQYDIISFSLGFAPKFFADNQDNKGSKMTSFSLNLFPGRWMQHFDYYYQKGLTLKTGDAALYLPEQRTMKIGGSTAYVFNKKFSFRALAFQSERQLKSAGSFAPILSYYYTELDSRKVPDIGTKSYFINVALSPSYNYNWVVAKKILIAGGISLGGGFIKTVDEGQSYTAFLSEASLSLAIGYNSDTFYGGVYSKGIATNHEDEGNVEMDDAINYATAFFGYRFNTPKKVREETKKIKDKLKL